MWYFKERTCGCKKALFLYGTEFFGGAKSEDISYR